MIEPRVTACRGGGVSEGVKGRLGVRGFEGEGASMCEGAHIWRQRWTSVPRCCCIAAELFLAR